MKVLIVGTGFSGSVIARKIADDFPQAAVTLLDKRDHFGGNAYDYYDEHGILVHKYGPHCFRTSDDEVYQFLSRFTEWHEGNHYVQSYVNGRLYQFPINLNTMEQILGKPVSEEDFREYLKTQRVPCDRPANAEEQCLALVGKQLYEMFFKGYTEKHWGCRAKDLLPEITARIPLRFNRNDYYTTARYKVMPKEGYAKLFSRMLDHPSIKVELKTSFDPERPQKHLRDLLIYTGKLDEYFDNDLGRLKYRSLVFKHDYYPGVEYKQPCVAINYPNKYLYDRTVEIKHMTEQKHPDTVVVREYAVSKGEPYYPFLDKENIERARRYSERAAVLKKEGIFFVGRLAEFKYYDMDHVVKRSLNLYQNEIKSFLTAKAQRV